MGKYEIVKRDQTVIVEIMQVYEYKGYTKKDDSKGSIQTLKVRFESGNVTMLKIWDRENYAFKSNHLIKATKVNTLKEKNGEYENLNLHTTDKTIIVYPFTKQTTLDSHIDGKENLKYDELTKRIDALQNIVALHEKELVALRESNISTITSIGVLEAKFQKKATKITEKKGKKT